MSDDVLGDKQWMAISLLAEGMSKIQVAEVVGVTRQTIHTWCKNEKFQDELTSAIIDVERAMRAERIQKARKVAGESLKQILKRLAKNPDDIGTSELRQLYKDAVSTMLLELKQVPEPVGEARDPDGEDVPVNDTEDLMGKPDFRRDLREAIKRHSHD